MMASDKEHIRHCILLALQLKSNAAAVICLGEDTVTTVQKLM
jgi:hypothetical protein